MNKIVCFGEVLWDMLPDGKKLGGAPLNVALRAQSVGNQVKMISAVGNDNLGKEILLELENRTTDTNHIQVLDSQETSQVIVSLNEQGSASYNIKQPCAWDFIEFLEKDITVVRDSDAFIFGSLVARNSVSRNTLFELLKHAKFKVFDVNLRPPHYNMETLKKLMMHADFIKFNNDEIIEICTDLGYEESDLEKCMIFIAIKTNSSHICVTNGDKGAILLSNNEFVYNAGFSVTVADTVGAGDSFLAIITSKLLEGADPQEAIDHASVMGALVASKNGANPTVTIDEINAMMQTK